MTLGGDALARVVRNLVPHEPPDNGRRFAAVSVIMRDTHFPHVLLIKRAERTGDPWSGQIAFPGGKMQPEDATAKDAAMRETMEEMGMDLRKAEFIGYAPPARTHTGNMDVVPAVFILKESAGIRTNEEVASYRWVDLADILDPRAQSTYKLSREGLEVELPAFKLDDYVVWGLTHRILTSVLGDLPEGPAGPVSG